MPKNRGLRAVQTAEHTYACKQYRSLFACAQKTGRVKMNQTGGPHSLNMISGNYKLKVSDLAGICSKLPFPDPRTDFTNWVIPGCQQSMSLFPSYKPVIKPNSFCGKLSKKEQADALRGTGDWDGYVGNLRKYSKCNPPKKSSSSSKFDGLTSRRRGRRPSGDPTINPYCTEYTNLFKCATRKGMIRPHYTSVGVVSRSTVDLTAYFPLGARIEILKPLYFCQRNVLADSFAKQSYASLRKTPGCTPRPSGSSSRFDGDIPRFFPMFPGKPGMMNPERHCQDNYGINAKLAKKVKHATIPRYMCPDKKYRVEGKCCVLDTSSPKYQIGDRVMFVKDWSYPIQFCETICPDCMDTSKGTMATITQSGAYQRRGDGSRAYSYSANVDGCGSTGMINEEYLGKAPSLITMMGVNDNNKWLIGIVAVIVFLILAKKI
tara:strand:- start:137 stop:1435 length:1299 start_codon:yes stop_codon:yes gene_type:complete